MFGFYYILNILKKIYSILFNRSKNTRLKIKKKLDEQYIYPSNISIGLSIDNVDF
mgnify:CR=1 FL=1